MRVGWKIGCAAVAAVLLFAGAFGIARYLSVDDSSPAGSLSASPPDSPRVAVLRPAGLPKLEYIAPPPPRQDDETADTPDDTSDGVTRQPSVPPVGGGDPDPEPPDRDPDPGFFQEGGS